MEKFQGLLAEEGLIYHSEAFRSLWFEYRRGNWKKKEWVQISLYQTRSTVSYKYAISAFMGEVRLMEGEINSISEVPEEFPFWVKKILHKAVKLKEETLGEKVSNI